MGLYAVVSKKFSLSCDSSVVSESAPKQSYHRGPWTRQRGHRGVHAVV
jgi:hypothetical protein